MKPYYLALSNAHGAWIDLESVLVIHDPLVPVRHPIKEVRENESLVNAFPSASFAVRFAFQNTAQTFESVDRAEEGIDMLLAAHKDLLEAWKNQ